MRISDWSSDVCSSDLCSCVCDVVPQSGRGPPGLGLLCASRQRQRQLLDRVRCHRRQMRDLLDRNRQLDLADAAHEFTRGDLDLHARERGADAAMHADTESDVAREIRSEEHTSELQSLMRIPYAVFCL